MSEKMNIARDLTYSLDTHKTYLNNNVLVIGTSGSGKTRSIVSPNILEATGSYVISDPKGQLYRKYADFLKLKGYEVRTLNLVDMANSDHYNPFEYIRSEQDIIKVAHILNFMDGGGQSRVKGDIFWDQASEILLSSLISYLVESVEMKERTLHYVFRLLEMIDVHMVTEGMECPYDILISDLEKKDEESLAAKQWKKVKEAADKTLRSVVISSAAAIGKLDFKECKKLMDKDDMRIPDIGKKKTAIFVIVSDTDRTMDGLANLFFSQAMNELFRAADMTENGRLHIPVRFILDDFATNVRIEDFPRMISSIRSREISVMIMIQALAQLRAAYGEDGTTIVANCDTMIYLGTNDVETAQNIADRIDKPLHDILYMPVNTNWVFRRGQEPVNSRNIDLEEFAADMGM